jgi:hypothetical protein
MTIKTIGLDQAKQDFLIHAVDEGNPLHILDAFVEKIDLDTLGFPSTDPKLFYYSE